MHPENSETQEGVWGGIKKAAGKVASVADTAVSAVPVVGTAYDAGVGLYKAGRTLQHGTTALRKWATGDKQGAAASAQKAKEAGVDTLGRAAGVGASVLAPGVGGAAASLATKVAAKPLVKAAVSGAVKPVLKSAARAGTAVAQNAIKKKPKISPAVPPTPPLVPAKQSESVLFQSVRALVEFRSLVGLPITQEHRAQLEAEESLDAGS
jgi:hypothetical protein